MGSKRKPRRGHNSSSSPVSSSDEISTTEETTPRRRSSDALAEAGRRRNTRKREDKVIWMLEWIKEGTKKLTEDTSKMQKQLNKLTESHNELRKQLELHINGSSGDDSSAPRSETKHAQQPPKYRLEFTCEVNDEIEKRQIIETKNNGKTISVVLYDDHNQIVATGPFASASVMLVVVNGEFNQHGNQYTWSRKDFERNIKRPRQGNSVMEDEHHPVESIVSSCVFKLDGGVKGHSDATILYNSSNKKVRLGVMVLSPTDERVLEGLSNLFFVRGHDRPARQCNPHNSGLKRLKHKARVGYGYQERNGSMLIGQNPSVTNLVQPEESRCNPAAGTLLFPGNTFTEASASIPQHQFSHLGTTSIGIAPATYNLPAGNEQLLLSGGNFAHPDLVSHDYSTGSENFPNATKGTHFSMDQIALPVQLRWDVPNVESTKRWSLLDQLMPLYSCAQKYTNYDSPTMGIMPELYVSLAIIPKQVMQSRRKRGVLIELLELEDSDEKRPRKRKSHTKYRLRFVNKVNEAYYTMNPIKADDGSHLKVALFDENDMKITFGPLSSASVEVVALHGDFNVNGQDYWTSEEFSHCVVCPWHRKEASVLGGDRILVLAEGEACLGNAFFQVTSFLARTGKFKMGVMLASVQEERIQEGISEPLLVKDRQLEGLPPAFRFHPTDEELILHYLCNRATIPEVDIYNMEPWDLPARAKFGDCEWYLSCFPKKEWHIFCHRKYPISSGYWMATGKARRLTLSGAAGKMLGSKRRLVFHLPSGKMTGWVMHEYHLPDNTTLRSIISSTTASSSTSSTRGEWVLCRIFKKTDLLQPSPFLDDDALVPPLRDCRLQAFLSV